MRPALRGSLIMILLVVAVGLAVWFGSLEPAPGYHDPPGGDELAHDYEAFVDERVEIYGRIIETDPVIISGEYEGRRLVLTVNNIEPSVSPGEYLHVYALVCPDRTLRAIDVVVYPDHGIWYTYLVSSIAVLWVLGRVVNGWRIDWEKLALVRRDSPILSRNGGSVPRA